MTPAREREGALPSRLPPGRHSLTREQVVADQRGRMIVALGEAMSDKGFANTTVADIIERAKVSRQTFYQLYDGKQACFMDAFVRIHEQLTESSVAVRPRSTPIEVVSAMLGRYLETIARSAPLARMYLIEVYAVGPEALRLRMQLQQNTIDGLAALVGATTDEGRFACRALISAVAALVTNELVSTGPDGVRELHAPLMTLAARLFGGHDGEA